jgi:Tfp pilus assembly protein PilV
MRRMTPRRRRGMTLIETLIGFLILFFVMLSVLQMFSMALAVNMGAAARTDLTHRAQRVAETIRTIYGFKSSHPTTFTAMLASSGVNLSSQNGTTVTVPPTTASEPFWASWAQVRPSGVPYTISYTVSSGAAGPWVVTVLAQPTTTGVTYPGIIGPGKAVTYVATVQ